MIKKLHCHIIVVSLMLLSCVPLAVVFVVVVFVIFLDRFNYLSCLIFSTSSTFDFSTCFNILCFHSEAISLESFFFFADVPEE